MTARVVNQPGYVLHHYDWSESSLVIETFTRQYGRVPLVARGAKKPSSSFRSVLLPLQALLLTWTGSGEVRNLSKAEWAGGAVLAAGRDEGDALLSGYYANELLMSLLARDDAYPLLFDGYAILVQTLCESLPAGGGASAPLRAFELMLLRQTGFLPALNLTTLTLEPLHGTSLYSLIPDGGLLARKSGDELTPALPGHCWSELETALREGAVFTSLLRAIEHWSPQRRAQLRLALRAWLDFQCGGRALNTRSLLLEIKTLIS